MTTKLVQLWGRDRVTWWGKKKATQLERLPVPPCKRKWDENWNDRPTCESWWAELKLGGNRQNNDGDGCQQPQRLKGTGEIEENTLSFHMWLKTRQYFTLLVYVCYSHPSSAATLEAKWSREAAQTGSTVLVRLVERRVHLGGCSKCKHFLISGILSFSE